MSIKDNTEEVKLRDFVLKGREWFYYLLSKWYVIFAAGLLGMSLGFLYSKTKQVLFKATTTFVLEAGETGGGGGIGQMAGLAALAGVDLGMSGGGIFQGDNLFELYKSRKMIESTLLLPSSSDSTILLIDRYLSLTNMRDQWREDKPELLKIDFSKNVSQELLRARDSVLQKAVQDINKNNLLVAKLDKKSAIIKVDVSSTDEVFSKEFNEALVAEVNEYYIKTKTKKSLDNIEILQHKTDSVRGVMNGNISASAVVIDATPNLNPTKQAQRLIPTQRSQFSAETNKAILGQLVQNLEMSKMALLKEAPLIQVVDNPIYPLQKESFSKLTGMIIGGIILFFISIIVLIFIKLFKDLFNEVQ